MNFLKNEYVGTGKKHAKKEVRSKSPDDALEVIREKNTKEAYKENRKEDNKQDHKQTI